MGVCLGLRVSVRLGLMMVIEFDSCNITDVDVVIERLI
jgi:hypothetical protein